MSFPKLTLSTFPSAEELQYLSDWETNDGTANVCISVWQYAKILLAMDQAGLINQRTKKALRELYFEHLPLTADELTERLGEKDKIVVQGQHGLGGFASAFLAQLRQEFPALVFPQPYSGTGNVFIQVILDLFLDKKDGNVYFYLRSRFRATLAVCFGDDVIKNW